MAAGHPSGEIVPDDLEASFAARSAVRRVVVVGAGIAGLACALACARAGARVEVLEAQGREVPVPAHVDVVPSLLRDLTRLGIGRASVQRGFAYSEIAVVDEHGNAGFRLSMQRLAGPQLPAAAGIALGDLLELLAQAAARSGATLHRGCTVQAVDPTRGRAVTDDGRSWEGDVVLLASGARSSMVEAVFGAVQPDAMPHAWWHALMPRPPWLDCPTWMAGSVGRRLLLVPISMAQAGLAVVGTAATGEPGDGASLTRLLASWGSMPRRLAAAIDASTPIAVRRVASSLRDVPWHRGSVLCVGAAAHSIAPPFGQPAAQALEDAVVLGELVAEGLERAALLSRFDERRAPRVRRLHALTERAAQWIAHPEPATDFAQLADAINALVAQPA